MSVIELKDVCKSYKEGGITNHVLKNISLKVEEREFVAILGQSGSGKSTLLNLIGGLDEADSGSVILNGKEYKGESDRVMSKYRRSMLGFVFQSFNLIPVLNVWENVVLPVRLDKQRIDKDYIEELLDVLDIGDKKGSLPTKLSGGQQQRVAIARALANKPQVILADEPTGNLDAETGKIVLDVFLNSLKKYGQTLIMITHNKEIAERADRVLHIRDGRIF